MDDKDWNSSFFEETFLLTDISMDIAFQILFLTLSNVEVNENAGAKRNNGTIVNSDYGSDNMWKITYLVATPLGYPWILRFDCSFQFLVPASRISNL